MMSKKVVATPLVKKADDWSDVHHFMQLFHFNFKPIHEQVRLPRAEPSPFQA